MTFLLILWFQEMQRFFTALHGMQTRSSDENSVCPSVCLSVRLSVIRVNCDKTVERSVEIYIPHESTFSLVFWEEEWLVGATPFTWNLGSSGPRWSEIADFKPTLPRSASAVITSEKTSINTNRKSIITRFPMSGVKSHFARRKSATKLLCGKTVSDKVVRHLLA